jgi:hypothetical protein
MGQEVFDQKGDVPLALAQGRQVDLQDPQPELQIGPEPARIGQGPEMPVGGGHDAHVHGLRGGGPKRMEALFLDDLQQL